MNEKEYFQQNYGQDNIADEHIQFMLNEQEKTFVPRPFEDLITEIEHDGERFVPIEEIAKLAFNHNQVTVSTNSMTWVNQSYDSRAYLKYKVYFQEIDEVIFLVGICRDFNVGTSIEINQMKSEHIPNNQVQIVKNLIKWGFVEP